MPASQAHLPLELQQAVLEQALSLTEAWAIQDQFLMSNSLWVEMPWELEPQIRKLVLWQSPAFNSLPS